MFGILPRADVQYAAYVFVMLAPWRWLQYVAEMRRGVKIALCSGWI
jgi:hypothetical protein